MILRNPYDTKPLDLVDVSRISRPLKHYVITDYMYIRSKIGQHSLLDKNIESSLDSKSYSPVFLVGLTDSEKDIPAFNHMLPVADSNILAMDLRPYVKLSPSKDNFEIRNQTEFGLAYRRYILSTQWYLGNENSIYSLKLSHMAYAEWISDGLTRKFGLGMGDQLRLKVLALIYYSSLFTDTFTSDDFDKLLIRSKEEILVPKLIEEVYQEAGTMKTLDDFCEACYIVTDNIRLKGLDTNLLFSLFSNSWMGSSSKELALLALSHPPTWCAMVYTSLTERSFKRTGIAGVIDRVNKRGRGDEFIQLINSVVNGVQGTNNNDW